MFAILVLSLEEPLCPTDATQGAEALWLNDERGVEPLHDRIYTERYIVNRPNRPNRPNRHHRCKKTIDALSPVVAPYLHTWDHTFQPSRERSQRPGWSLRCHLHTTMRELRCENEIERAIVIVSGGIVVGPRAFAKTLRCKRQYCLNVSSLGKGFVR
jgi:hypothetical protein